jgi:hypothetical protein
VKHLTRIMLLAVVLAGAALAYGLAAQEEKTPTPDPMLEEFIPTEKLPADSAISFPVDI